MKHVLKLILLITLISVSVDSANILGIFYMPYLSHYMLGQTLMKELATRGHNVTMLSSYPPKEPIANYTHISTSEEIPKFGAELARESATVAKKDRWKVMVNAFLKTVHILFESKTVKNLIRDDNNKFDLIISDSPNGEVLLGLTHKFNAPAIYFNSVGDSPIFSKYTGNYYPLSYLNGAGLNDLTTFAGRFNNVFKMLTVVPFMLTIYFEKFLNDLYDKYMPDVPPLEELYKNVALVLTNTHFTYDTPRPYTPNAIEIGGFNLVKRKPLKEDMKTWLDNSENGIILVSYGSGVSGFVFDNNKISMFLNVFSKLKQKVLWKFDVNEIKNKTNIQKLPDNIKFEKWIPQKEVLSHPNVIAFITHGGMGAFSEAVYGGVPMIGTPSFDDQIKNIRTMSKDYGYGIELDFDSLSEPILEKAINELLTNPEYTERIKKASKAFRNQPICPMEKAMYWIEHVIKYRGADHLKPASLNLHSYQHQLLDVTLFLFTITGLMAYTSYYVVRKLFKHVSKIKRNN